MFMAAWLALRDSGSSKAGATEVGVVQLKNGGSVWNSIKDA
jgi:hypothetical protein